MLGTWTLWDAELLSRPSLARQIAEELLRLVGERVLLREPGPRIQEPRSF